MARSRAAWERLVAEGFAASRDDAARWILSGKVRAGNLAVTSAGQRIAEDAPLFVKGADQRYAGRGGLKLEGALRDFGIDVRGAACIDAGASTGGFSDCLLQHGAARVYAVDVGFGQLSGRLRLHPGIVNLERTNIGDAALLALSPTPTLGTVDLSYLSLRKAVPLFAAILQGRGELVCLVKPLFEIDDPGARRSGIIAEDAYAPLLTALMDALAGDGYPACGVTNSPITGNNATREFFLHIRLGAKETLSAEARQQAIDRAVQAALALTV